MAASTSTVAHPAERIIRPGEQELLDAWRQVVEAHDEQERRLRETDPEPDFWEEHFNKLTIDVSQPPPMIESLRPVLDPGDRWLDVGAGIGQAALPLSRYVREVVALDPSPGCLDLMRGWIEKNGIENVRALPPMSWPPPEPLGRFDGCIAKHVHNFVADIGGFLDAMEQHATRLCVIGAAELGTACQPHHATFEALHGEAFIRLPGVQELLAILGARRRRFDVQAFDFSQYQPQDLDDAQRMVRGEYLVREGSEKDRRLRELLKERFSVSDGLVHLPQMAGTYQIFVSWAPPSTLA